ASGKNGGRVRPRWRAASCAAGAPQHSAAPEAVARSVGCSSDLPPVQRCPVPFRLLGSCEPIVFWLLRLTRIRAAGPLTDRPLGAIPGLADRIVRIVYQPGFRSALPPPCLMALNDASWAMRRW